MARLSPKQIGLLIAVAHWGPGTNSQDAIDFLDTAIAVALAESGGNTRAVSSTGDYGLWQINKAAHPNYFDNPDAVFNPWTNTLFAKAIWTDAGRSWTPWSTYKNGSYKKYRGHGKRVWTYLNGLTTEQFYAEVRKIPEANFPQTGGGIQRSANPLEYGLNEILPGDPGTAIRDSIGGLGDKLVYGAKAAGFFVLAIILLIVGVLFLLKDTKTAQSVFSVASPISKAKKVLS